MGNWKRKNSSKIFLKSKYKGNTKECRKKCKKREIKPFLLKIYKRKKNKSSFGF
jgi:hypothetical protein